MVLLCVTDLENHSTSVSVHNLGSTVCGITSNRRSARNAAGRMKPRGPSSRVRDLTADIAETRSFLRQKMWASAKANQTQNEIKLNQTVKLNKTMKERRESRGLGPQLSRQEYYKKYFPEDFPDKEKQKIEAMRKALKRTKPEHKYIAFRGGMLLRDRMALIVQSYDEAEAARNMTLTPLPVPNPSQQQSWNELVTQFGRSFSPTDDNRPPDEQAFYSLPESHVSRTLCRTRSSSSCLRSSTDRTPEKVQVCGLRPNSKPCGMSPCDRMSLDFLLSSDGKGNSTTNSTRLTALYNAGETYQRTQYSISSLSGTPVPTYPRNDVKRSAPSDPLWQKPPTKKRHMFDIVGVLNDITSVPETTIPDVADEVCDQIEALNSCQYRQSSVRPSAAQTDEAYGTLSESGTPPAERFYEFEPQVPMMSIRNLLN